MESTMKDFEIRSAVRTDAEHINYLFRERGKTDDEKHVLARVARATEDMENLLALAVIGGNAVGYIWVQNYGPHLRTGMSIARLQDIFVRPPERRSGIAKALFKYGEEWCKKNGISYLQWQATAEAIHFYESLGLTPDTKSDLEENPFFEIDFTKNKSLH